MDKLLRSALGEVRLVLPATADSPPTVTITDSAGAIVTSGSSGVVAGGTYKFPLQPSQLGTLDVYTVTWVATIGGVADTYTTYVEIIGANLFSIAEARVFDNGAMGSVTKFPDADIVEVRDQVAEHLENLCSVSFIPRGFRATLDGSGASSLDVPHILVPSKGIGAAGRLISASIDGVVLSAPEVADVSVRRKTLLRKTLGYWALGIDNIVLFYEHGYREPPDPVKRAALKLARHVLVPSNIDDVTISFSDELGTRQFAVAGRKGQPTGIPWVDSIVSRYGESSIGVW